MSSRPSLSTSPPGHSSGVLSVQSYRICVRKFVYLFSHYNAEDPRQNCNKKNNKNVYINTTPVDATSTHGAGVRDVVGRARVVINLNEKFERVSV